MTRPYFLSIAYLLVSCTPAVRTDTAEQGRAPAEATMRFVLPGLQDTAWAEVYVPTGVRNVRAVVAFVDRGLDQYAYDDRSWRAMCARAQCALLRLGLPRQGATPPAVQVVRNASLGGGAALLHALELAAAQIGHPEVRDANVLIFGFSAAGNFGPTFAMWRPDRIIGFIRYHSSLRGIPLDTAALARVPALTIVGERDDVAGSEDSRALWEVLRSRGAPWAYVSHLDQPHFSVDGLIGAGVLMREWTEAILASRIPAHSTTLPQELVLISLSDGWLVDDFTKGVATVGLPRVPRSRISWVPSQAAAQELRLLAGICKTVPLGTVTELFGADVRVAIDEVSACRYTAGSGTRDLWLSTTLLQSARAAGDQLEASRLAANGQALSGLGGASFFIADRTRKCSTIWVSLLRRTYSASLCGDAFGYASDSTSLRQVARHMLGVP